MKKIIEKIKDILYDTFDYVVMLGIVVAVVAVIGWRLDVLFASDVKDIPATEIHTAVGSGSSTGEESEEEKNGEDGEKVDNPDGKAAEVKGTETLEEPNDSQPAKPMGEMIKVEIPEGSHPGKIGSILVDAGVIDDSKNFISRAIELGKETKLKSGKFDIPKGSNYEEVIAILSK
ncbi:endolytic transglycosylase MltG [Tissierella creatinini]|nr:endolytic transglycosylase MltG [Tissierella creatinini]TJX63796.1 endolytic transglycosylase MltG [Soehngenia saccharolytica]